MFVNKSMQIKLVSRCSMKTSDRKIVDLLSKESGSSVIRIASGKSGIFINSTLLLHSFNVYSFTGECNQPDALIRSCQEPGNQFLIANQKFTINYTKCEGIKESLSGGKSYIDMCHSVFVIIVVL